MQCDACSTFPTEVVMEMTGTNVVDMEVGDEKFIR